MRIPLALGRAALALALLGALAGCASVTPLVSRGDGALPPRAEVAGVPFFPQERYYCGPAALGMALVWSGVAVEPTALVAQVYTPGREGSLRTDLLAAARRLGRLAVPVTTTRALLGELAAGHPVVVFQNLGLGWLPQWHFAVALGYDLAAEELVLHSGVYERHRVSLRTFERTWARGDRWALVILPPAVLPVTADEVAVLRAAAALERVGRPEDAAAAYTAITARWPESHAGLVGLGNARFALADYAGAEVAFRAAVARRPDAAAGWNNLAHALARQGRRDAAIAAAREALRLAGGQGRTYERTLREVSTE